MCFKDTLKESDDMKKILLIIWLAVTAWTFSHADEKTPLVRIQSMEAHSADKHLVVSMRFVADSLQLRANQLLAYTPVITDGQGNERRLPAFLLTGRNEHIYYLRAGNRNYKNVLAEMRRDKGRQTYDYSYTLPYEAWMKGAHLRVAEDRCGCGNIEEAETYPGLRIDYDPFDEVRFSFVTPREETTKVREEKGSAFLDFPVNRTEIHPDYRKNPVELAKILRTIDLVRNDPKVLISAIDIHGYASPEGSFANNERLAKGRSLALKEYVRRLYALSDTLFHVTYTPEDWQGLRQAVEQSDLPHQAELLKLIGSTFPEDEREKALRETYPEEYRRLLTEIYPGLRHADYRVEYIVRPFTVEEAKAVFRTKPKQLSLSEFFLLGNSYEPGTQEYNEVFETAARLFPDAPEANLNAANIALQKRDAATAEKLLSRAGNSPAATNARGLLALLRKDEGTARRLLRQAADQGLQEAKTNLEKINQK